MRKNFDIILLGLFRWDGPYSSISIAMAKEFAKNNRVFYVNHPYTWRDYYTILKTSDKAALRKKLRSDRNIYTTDRNVGENFLNVTPPLTYPINFLPKGKVYNYFYQKNKTRISHSIETLISDHDINDFIFINCFDPFYTPAFKSGQQPLLNIYQCVDDISQSDYTLKHGPWLEEEAIKAADLTLVTSVELHRLKSELTDKIHILNNAADIKIFEKAMHSDFAKPEELESIQSPIIGYIGNLDELRIDYELIKRVAEEHHDKNLVLVGPINNKKYKEIGLDRIKNVYFLGKKPIEQLPPYLKYFDCCIIPFQCNTLTKSIYPLKINEYLAAGKPVVATNFSEDISSFTEHIYLSKTVGEFSNYITKALAEDSPSLAMSRHELARQNTWEGRISQFWEIVQDYIRAEVARENCKS